MHEQRKWVLELESTPGEDAVKIIEMITKHLEYDLNSVDKATSGFQKIDSSFERSFTVGKMLSNSVSCYREIPHERKKQWMQQLSLLFCFKISPQAPQPLVNPILIRQQPSTLRQDPSPAKRFQLPKGSDDE